MTRSPRDAPTQRPWDWASLRTQCLREAQTLLGRTALAEDAAQEAALRAWLHRDRCRRPEQPGPWVAAIARREALRLITQKKPAEQPLAALEPAVASGESELLLRIAVSAIAVATLDEADRKLLRARYSADLTHEQIALALGVPCGTIKVRLHRIRRRLRDELLACGVDA